MIKSETVRMNLTSLPSLGDHGSMGLHLLSKAEALADLPALCLRVVAVAGKPTKLKEIHEIASVFRPKETTEKEVSETLSQLVAEGLLRSSRSTYTCPECLAQDVAIMACQGSVGKRIARHYRSSVPVAWNHPRYLPQAQAHIRWTLLTGSERDVAALSRLNSGAVESAFIAVGRELSRPESFLAFPTALSHAFLRDTLYSSVNTPFPADAALLALVRVVTSPECPENLKTLLAHQLLLRGEREAADELLERFPREEMRFYRDILAGEVDKLPSKFSLVVAPTTMTVKFAFRVAALATGCEISFPDAQRWSKDACEEITDWLVGAIKRGRPLAGSRVADLYHQVASAPTSSCYYRPHLALALHWTGYTEEAAELARPDWAHQYRQAGYHTLAEWLERASGGREASSLSSAFMDLLRPSERWSHALEALREWAESVDVPKVSEKEERIVWEIEPFYTRREICMKIQTKGKKGQWSAGRTKRVGEVWQDPPGCSDEHDMRVFDAYANYVARQRGHFYHGYHSSELDDVILRALEGHPRLRLKSEPTREIDLAHGEPALVMTQRGDRYHLAVHPPMPGREAVFAQRESPSRIVLYKFTRRLVALAQVLGKGLEIPISEKKTLQSILTQMGQRSEIAIVSELAAKSQTVPMVETDSTLIIRLSPRGGGLSVQTRVAPLGEDGPLLLPGEGSAIVLGRDSQGQSVQTRRDLEGEAKTLREVREHASQLRGTDFELLDPEECLDLLESFHDPFPSVRLEWPEGRRFELKGKSSGLSWQRAREDSDWFEVDGELRVNEELVLSLNDLLRLRSRTGSRFVQLDDGTYLALTQELHRYLSRLQRFSVAPTGSGQVKLSKLAALAALEGQEESLQADLALKKLRDRANSTTGARARLPKAFTGELRPYQLEGYRWMTRLAHWGVGACLADDMGLGKTIQILALLAARAEQGPTLVVAPTSVGWNWKEEAARFTPGLRVSLLAETDRSAVLASAGPGEVIVASYGLLVREVERLSAVDWSTVVLDEAQAIKNSQTQRAQAALTLKAQMRVAATGTPVENHLEELWSLFRWLNPGLLGSQRWFQSSFPARDEEAQADLARLIRPFILRRIKDQVLKDLPARTDICLRVELSEAETALYESLRREAVERLSGDPDDYLGVLAELTRLRRACCHPSLVVPEWRLPSSKLQTFRTLTEELMENGHRALVFSQFVSHLKVLAEDLDERGIGYEYLDGSTPVAARRAAVERFQTGSCPLFLISLKAGGTGLNLTAADYVLHMDPWWNPAVEDQASDRAHRIGQQRPVTVYRLVARATVEERIVALHEEKRDLAERLLQGADSAAKLSAKELLALL